jgi:hypothetical protein
VKEHKLRQHPDGVRHYLVSRTQNLVSRTQIDARSGRERAGGSQPKLLSMKWGPLAGLIGLAGMVGN